MYIDTHTHLYDEQFQLDHLQVVQNAINKGVEIMLLPNSNIETISPMLEMARTWPKNCLPMMGLHPCEVNKNFQKKLDEMKPLIIAGKYIAIGEVGLDYHWDLTFKNEQLSAFKEQINWALEFDLPLSIHTRKSIEDGISIIREKQNGKLKGVFHCFSGTIEQAEEIISLGFYLGIGGVATFKNGGLEELLKKMDLKYLLVFAHLLQS